MAKALMAGFLVLFGILTPVGTASGDEIPLSGEGVALYDGPSSFVNSSDPFQTIRWMTGLYIPKSALLNSGGAEIVSRLEYDVEWRRALISYYAGQQQILPPVALSLQEYSEQALLDQLRRTHREEATRSVLRSSANAPRQEDGLFSFDLVEIPFTEKLFGKGAPNLTVRGRENITISGTSSWEVGRNDNEFGGQSIFPKLDMRQDLNVQLKGTIGSKLTVDIAQNSNALTPLENAIKIRYKGEEDEVLQTVELGNTNLSLPATQYVSYSARQEGLFGVKATAKVGSLDITAIASRQEGQSGDASLRGGSQQGVSVVRDMDFIKGKFFFLSDPDSAAFPRIDFSTLAIYLDDNINLQQNDQEKTEIEAEVFLDPTAPGLTPDPYEGRFHQLIQIEDYTLSNDVNYSIPILELRSPLQTDQTLAIAYIDTINVGGLDVVREVGTVTLSEGDTTAISLKMIRPQENEFDGEDFTSDFWTPTRRYEIKGWYRIGDVRDVDEESFELQIFRKTDTERRPSANVAGTEIPYLEILGLDQEDNATGERIPDGRVDRRYIDYSNGYIFFPDLR
ncbi:MAG: hypothetical protein HKN21_17240, partial [Candidatus Eisenbacteria bacterium]|nr:hypothetical protein [Candidatus Eisenbacteria bacterium]